MTPARLEVPYPMGLGSTRIILATITDAFRNGYDQLHTALVDSHLLLGYPGTNAMYNMLNLKGFKVKKREIQKVIHHCLECNLNKARPKIHLLSHRSLHSKVVGSTLSADICGPFDITDSLNRQETIYVLSFIDNSSGYCEVKI